MTSNRFDVNYGRRRVWGAARLSIPFYCSFLGRFSLYLLLLWPVSFPGHSGTCPKFQIWAGERPRRAVPKHVYRRQTVGAPALSGLRSASSARGIVPQHSWKSRLRTQPLHRLHPRRRFFSGTLWLYSLPLVHILCTPFHTLSFWTKKKMKWLWRNYKR